MYVEMLSNPSIADNLRKSLESALPEFYASVLVFSVKARLYFDPSTSSKFQLYITYHIPLANLDV